MTKRVESENQELLALLAGCSSPEEREQIIRAYYALTSGDPGSFPAQFALVTNAQLRAALAIPDRIQSAILKSVDSAVEKRLSIVTETLKELGSPVRSKLIQIERVARTAERVQAKALLFLLAASCAFGSVITLLIQAVFRTGHL